MGTNDLQKHIFYSISQQVTMRMSKNTYVMNVPDDVSGVPLRITGSAYFWAPWQFSVRKAALAQIQWRRFGKSHVSFNLCRFRVQVNDIPVIPPPTNSWSGQVSFWDVCFADSTALCRQHTRRTAYPYGQRFAIRGVATRSMSVSTPKRPTVNWQPGNIAGEKLRFWRSESVKCRVAKMT